MELVNALRLSVCPKCQRKRQLKKLCSNFRLVSTALVFLSILSPTRGTGRVEFLLDSYSNPLGRLNSGLCCPTGNVSVCPGHCNVYIYLCIQRFRSPSDDSTPAELEDLECSYGSTASDFFSDTGSEKLALRVPFQFSWPGSMTLVAELRHLDRQTDRDWRIRRSAEALELSSLDEWRAVDAGSSQIDFQFRVRVSCDETYFGPACNLHCRPEEDDDKGHYTCSQEGVRVCLDGWTGTNCNDPLCSEACVHGTCVGPDTCKCEYGWVGDVCGDCVPYEGCDHGYCTRPFECKCEERWGGLQCDADLDYCLHHAPCRNGATCVPHAPDNYTCVCTNGFTGRDCEMRVSPCWANPCRHFGTCVVTGDSYQCLCPHRYSGRHCQHLQQQPREAGPADETGWRPCFYLGQQRPHQSRWDTMDCRQCNCWDGSVNCTESACQADDCLAPTTDHGPDTVPAALYTPRCPRDQVCESVMRGTCLKGGCGQLLGRCKPWHLLEAAVDGVCRHRLDLGHHPDRCSRFYLRLNSDLLPEGTTMEGVCFHMLLVLLTRKLDQYTVNCRLIQPGDPKKPILQVDMVSVRSRWSVEGLKELMMATLEQNQTASPLLAAVDQVLPELRAPMRHVTTDQSESESPPKEVPWRLILLGCLPVCLLLVMGLLGYGIWRLRRRLRVPNRPEPEGESPIATLETAVNFYRNQIQVDNEKNEKLQYLNSCESLKRTKNSTSSDNRCSSNNNNNHLTCV